MPGHCAHLVRSARRVVRSIVRSVVRSIVCTMRALHCVSNEAAQWKTVVRSALHNGLATVGGAIPALHNVFGIVRILFDGIFLNATQ